MKILEIIDELEKNSQIKEIKNFERKTSEDIEISDITYNSKEAKKNSLFICKGNAFKREYLLDSIKNGSVAYISEIDYSDYLTCETYYNYCGKRCKTFYGNIGKSVL